MNKINPVHSLLSLQTTVSDQDSIGTAFDYGISWIRIRIPNADPDPEGLKSA
jgi:hypothetical protein